jgi:hypothetical protein
LALTLQQFPEPFQSQLYRLSIPDHNPNAHRLRLLRLTG